MRRLGLMVVLLALCAACGGGGSASGDDGGTGGGANADGGTNGADAGQYQLGCDDPRLDPSFGQGGCVVTDFPEGAAAYVAAQQADGKIVAAGYADQGAERVFAVVRYNADGSVDTGFGEAGKVLIPFEAGRHAVARALHIQADGKILVGGAGTWEEAKSPSYYLARLTPDGQIDNTFGGGNGISGVAFTVNVALGEMLVYPDGRILFVGNTATDYQDAVLVRFRADGERDNSFGTNAAQLHLFGQFDTLWLNNAWIEGTKVRAAGHFNHGFDFFQFNEDGTVDTAFGTNGVLQHDVVPDASQEQGRLHNAAKLGDGKYLLMGVRATASEEVILAHFNPDGTVDSAFGTGGQTNTPYDDPLPPITFAGAVQSDGRINLVGRGLSNETVSRFNADGTRDTTFGNDGLNYRTITGPIEPGSSFPNAIISLPSGGSLIPGRAQPPIGTGDNRRRFVVKKLLP